MRNRQTDAPFVALPLGVFVEAIVASLELKDKSKVSTQA